MTNEQRMLSSKPSAAERGRVQQPVKVLIVDGAVAFGGSLVVARCLLKNLDSRAVNASLVSACRDGFVSGNFAGDAGVRLISPRVDYVTLANWKLAVHKKFRWKPLRRIAELSVIIAGILANVPYVVRLARLCRQIGVEVLHVNGTGEALWVARLLGIPVVRHFHGYLPPQLEGSVKRNFRRVKVFIAVSRGVTESAVCAGIDRARIRVIPNCVERLPDAVPPPMPAVQAIGIFGRVIPWKGQKEFLFAALRVLPNFPDLRVLIVGDASDGPPSYIEECREMARNSPFSDQIEFTGRVSDVVPYYRRCTVVVHASIEPEPGAMVLIEAMAEARPVIGSPFGYASEIIANGVEGYIVDPNDRDALAARIAELLANPALATAMGIRGHEKVRTFYNPRIFAREFERLYADVARSTPVSRSSP